MSLAYVRDEYEKLSKNMLDGNIDVNNVDSMNKFYEELEKLGEHNIKQRIENINNKENIEDNNLNLIKDIFREVNGQDKPEMIITIQNEEYKEEINLKNERNIYTSEMYEESGHISIVIFNYYTYKENENIDKFIKAKGENIKIEIEKVQFKDNNLSVEINYIIKFNKKTPKGRYRQVIEIAFKDLESRIYEFIISCNDENKKIYNFKFDSIDKLYNIFKNQVENYYRNTSDNFKNIEDIFNHKDFSNYLRDIKEYAAYNLYKSLSIRTYRLEDINLFFENLGYKPFIIVESYPKEKTNIMVKSINEDIKFKLFKFYYIQDIDNEFKLKIFNNKNKEIEIKKVSDSIPKNINKILSILFKEKMERFNSCIFIKDKNILKSIFTYYIKKEEVGKSFKVIISSKKSIHELNLYNLKIHM